MRPNGTFLKADVHASDFDRRSIPAGVVEGIWTAPDGWEHRRLEWKSDSPNPRGSLLFMTGRADFYEKYLESFYDFQRAGWNVTSIDWRGQGGSGRCGPHPYVGHIADFSIWTDDLAAMFDDWSASHPGPHVVLGHSMGGHIVMRALAQQKIHPDAVILSAPMIAPAGGGMPEWAAHLAAKTMCLIGRAQQEAWKTDPTPLEPDPTRQHLLTHDATRYADEYVWKAGRPELQLGPASWRWVERAYASASKLRNPVKLRKVKVPILFLATAIDELVDNCAIELAHQFVPNSILKLFGEECAHEIFREVDAVRQEAMTSCIEFLDQVAPQKPEQKK